MSFTIETEQEQNNKMSLLDGNIREQGNLWQMSIKSQLLVVYTLILRACYKIPAI